MEGAGPDSERELRAELEAVQSMLKLARAELTEAQQQRAEARASTVATLEEQQGTAGSSASASTRCAPRRAPSSRS